MLRIVGGSMILLGCFGLGLWYRQQFILRLQTLRTLLGILDMLMSDIRYGKSTLPESCKRIGERQKEPYRSSFLEIYRTMEENGGECFPQVFCRHMEKCLRQLPIKAKDGEQFLAFAAGDSFEDGRMQLRTVERSKELLQLTVEGLEKENAEKCRLAVGLGAMSGLLLVIVLL